jgi:ribonuclease VapC
MGRLVIVLETSAAVAFVLGEPDAEEILRKLILSLDTSMSAIAHYEAKIVIWGKRKKLHPLVKLEALLSSCNVNIIPFDATQADLAFAAYQKIGKGSGHPAQLNLADCASYALAKSLNAPLLFVGQDFDKTDVLRPE